MIYYMYILKSAILTNCDLCKSMVRRDSSFQPLKASSIRLFDWHLALLSQTTEMLLLPPHPPPLMQVSRKCQRGDRLWIAWRDPIKNLPRKRASARWNNADCRRLLFRSPSVGRSTTIQKYITNAHSAGDGTRSSRKAHLNNSSPWAIQAIASSVIGEYMLYTIKMLYTCTLVYIHRRIGHNSSICKVW